MNLILLDPSEVSSSEAVRLEGPRATHIRMVLKAVPGDTIRIGVIDGPRGRGTVTSLAPDFVSLRCEFDDDAPPPPPVDLLLALPRPKVMKRLWSQVAALGVRRIMLTNATRVERNYFDTTVLEPACYRPLLLDGLQQARDTRLPRVTVHRQLKVFLEDELGPREGPRILADPRAARSMDTLLDALRPRQALLAVGPEGGWTDYEREMLGTHGFTAGSMGPRTLRSDTACIALLALVHAALIQAEG